MAGPGVHDGIHQLSETRPVRSTDVVILMIGGTGSGRSRFINAVAGGHSPPRKVGDSQESCTMDVEHVVLEAIPVGPGSKPVRAVLVDTPGLNNSKPDKPDSLVLAAISEWSQQWLPSSGCTAGIIIIHDVNTHFEQRIKDTHISTLRKSFEMVVATSKWEYQDDAKAREVHSTLMGKWEKHSKNARFYKFNQDSDALPILQGILSQAKNVTKADFVKTFDAMAESRRKKEGKQDSRWKKIFGFMAFWK